MPAEWNPQEETRLRRLMMDAGAREVGEMIWEIPWPGMLGFARSRRRSEALSELLGAALRWPRVSISYGDDPIEDQIPGEWRHLGGDRGITR